MKSKILLMTAILASATACSHKQAAEEPKTPVETLRERLITLQDTTGFAFGHHDDTAYGYYWAYMPDSSDVRGVTGDYPAVMNWDLGWIELGGDKNLDGVPFDFIRDEIKRHASLGGINTISWHLQNPLTAGNSWDTSSDQVVARAVTDGDSVNTVMRQWLATVADFMNSLQDAEGSDIAVVFRPWHEHTGEWFWWGNGYRTPDQYKALWHLTREVFDEKGVDNVLWAYSPDKSNVSGVEDYMECYPGDEYVDIMGADVYHFNGEEGVEIFNQWMSTTLSAAVEMAKQHDKIAALTETGSEALVLPDWYTRVLFPAIKDYPIAYITVWRNAMPEMKANHFYAPYPGHASAPDFVEFYNLPEIFFLSDIKDI